MTRDEIAVMAETLADALADFAYNKMQKSEEANATFDLAQSVRRWAQMTQDTAASSARPQASALSNA